MSLLDGIATESKRVMIIGRYLMKQMRIGYSILSLSKKRLIDCFNEYCIRIADEMCLVHVLTPLPVINAGIQNITFSQ